MTFETVHEVWDYWDGIRSGFADYRGIPHHFEAEWNPADDDYRSTFTLRRVEGSTIALARERNEIFEKWRWALHRGEVSPESHPGLSDQNPRFAELTQVIRSRIETAPITAWGVSGTFAAVKTERDQPPGIVREVRVEWSSTP
jgi:hypothetical protein